MNSEKLTGSTQTWEYWVIESWQPQFNCITWGVEARDQQGRLAAKVEDITPDRQFACRLARLFTQQGLEPVHLAEVTQDFLAWPPLLDEAERRCGR